MVVICLSGLNNLFASNGGLDADVYVVGVLLRIGIALGIQGLLCITLDLRGLGIERVWQDLE
jgi:hypothetical protein